MTAREKKLGFAFLLMLAGSVLFLNFYTAFSSRADALRLIKEYDMLHPLALRMRGQLAERRVALALLQKANHAGSEVKTDPYMLGAISRDLLSKSGAAIRSFTMSEKNGRPFIESSISSNPGFLPVFFDLLEKSDPALTVSFFSLAETRSLDFAMVVRMGYASGN